MFIDTHAHVQFSGFDGEAEAIMQRAFGSGVGVINVGTQIDTSREAVAMLKQYQENLWVVVGLHPEHTYQHMVDEEESHFRSREEIFDYEAYKSLAQNNRVVGIGECGLDYYRFDSLVSSQPPSSEAEGEPGSMGLDSRFHGNDTNAIKQKQKDVFKQQIKLALELDKALVVHCRPSPGMVDAYEDLLEIVSSFKLQAPSLRFEIHCFTGTLEIAQKFVSLGGFLGLNGIITFDKTGNSELVVKNIPLEHLILETDCPYLAPVPFRGKRNEPSYVKYVAEKIAEWKNITIGEVENQTTQNAKNLFNI